MQKLSRSTACLALLLYFVPFLYCLYLSCSDGKRLYEKQLVWLYIVMCLPILLTYQIRRAA